MACAGAKALKCASSSVCLGVHVQYIQLWGSSLSYRTSDVAPIVATIVAVLVLRAKDKGGV